MPGQTDMEILDGVTDAGTETPSEGAGTTEEAKTTPEGEPPEGETPAAEGEVAKPGEEKTEPEAEEAKDEDEEKVEEEIELSDEEKLTPKSLGARIAKNPAFKSLLDEDKSLKDSLFAMARRAAKLDAIQEYFQTAEQAKFAADAVEELGKFDQLFFSDEPNAPVEFLQSLYQNSLLRDENGEVITDEDTGRPQSTGAYERVTAAYRASLWPEVRSFLEHADRKDLAESLQEIVELIGDVKPAKAAKRANGKASSDEEDKLSPDIRQRLDKAERTEAKMTAIERQQEQAFFAEVDSKINEKLTSDAERIINTLTSEHHIALTKYAKAKIVEDALKGVFSEARKNAAYQRQLQAMLRSTPRTEDGKIQLITLAVKTGKVSLGRYLSQYLKEATDGMVPAQNERVTKMLNQTERREPKASGGVSQPSRPVLTPEAVNRMNKERQKAGKGRLSDMEVLEM